MESSSNKRSARAREYRSWWIILIGSSAIFSFWSSGSDVDSVARIAYATGKSAGVLILAAFAPGIMSAFKRIRGDHLHGGTWMSVYSVAILILILLSTIGQREDRHESGIRTPNGAHVFSPEPKEFSARFPQRPTLKTIKNETGLVAETAELVIVKDSALLRAEVIPLSPSSDEPFIDAFESIAHQYVRHEGLRNSTFHRRETEKGDMFEIRGYKAIGLSGQERTLYTFAVELYAGRASVMVVQGGAPSYIFPPHSVSVFLESVARDDVR